MPKLTTTATTSVVTRTTLSPRLTTALTLKRKEHSALAARIKKDQDRQEAVKKEIEALCEAEGEYGALIEGVKFDDGGTIKVVTGTTNKLDEQKLMRTHNLTQADLDACTDTRPKRPYLQVSAPRTKKGDE